MRRVFLDANVLFAGTLSAVGASRLVLLLARERIYRFLTSRLAFWEAERNLREKAGARALRVFYFLLKKSAIDMASDACSQDVEAFQKIIHVKDAPVIAAAFAAQCDYFLTLDRKHFLKPKVRDAIARPRILTPGEFIATVYLQGDEKDV
ncbi:MAG: PIN domain-containing protein [Candidatus Omnitrophota bacterium]